MLEIRTRSLRTTVLDDSASLEGLERSTSAASDNRSASELEVSQ